MQRPKRKSYGSKNNVRYKDIKGKVWEEVRAYIKRYETDCYTCPARDLEGQNAQAGHFFPVGLVGSNNCLSWDYRQIHLQCGRCNGVGQGMAIPYKAHLIRDYGEAVVEELEHLNYLATTCHQSNPVKNWQLILSSYTEDTPYFVSVSVDEKSSPSTGWVIAAMVY